MEKINDNLQFDDDIDVLGIASVETMGPADGTSEPLGRIVLPGIAEE